MSALPVPPIINLRGTLASGRVLFLDRDGVINVNFGYVHTPERTTWVEGVFDFCRVAVQKGYGLVVVTNQAGIARGLYTEEQFASYTEWMLQQFSMQGVDILRVYYCPHHPTAGEGLYRVDCECRKPCPGMILAAAEDLGVDLALSMMIGDKASDMQAAQAAGIGKRILLDDGRELSSLQDCGVIQVHGFDEACKVMLEAG